MQDALTIADIVGSILYLLTAALALWAAQADGARSRTPGAARFHWIAVAALFVGAAAWRLGNGEGRVQAMLRGGLEEGGQYASRYGLQAPVIAVFVLVAVLACGWLAWRWRSMPVHRALSAAGALGLLAFSMVRLISFHPLDRLIYASFGPLRLNYLIELALIGAVAAGAWLLWSGAAHKRVRSRGEGMRRSKRR